MLLDQSVSADRATEVPVFVCLRVISAIMRLRQEDHKVREIRAEGFHAKR